MNAWQREHPEQRIREPRAEAEYHENIEAAIQRLWEQVA